jgi:hypothetical protein
LVNNKCIQNFGGKTCCKYPNGSARGRLKENSNVRKIGYEDRMWMELSQDRVQLWVIVLKNHVKMVMNGDLRGSSKQPIMEYIV